MACNNHVVRDSREKFFATFPYPYMNGTLHLGHAFTLSKAIFISEFQRLNGKNVLFPFAFHGTGMPIVACAAKLKNELETLNYPDGVDITNLDKKLQIKILLDMNVPFKDLPKFIDPKYWLCYFPEEAKKDLIAFNSKVDLERSFITTDMNPYYDSFIKWQFTKLQMKNLIVKGKRYVIYSVKDQQPCADHDRSTGEQVEPEKYNTYIVKTSDGLNLVAIVQDSVESENSEITGSNEEQLYYDPQAKYEIFEYHGEKYIVTEFALKNLTHQLDNVKHSGSIDINSLSISTNLVQKKNLKGPGFVITRHATSKYADGFPYYEPKDPVKSRSGDTCIVALTTQLFINYGDEALTTDVNSYLKNKIFTNDQSVTNNLIASSEWLNEWPCSRDYGMGTKMPGTIGADSLIDSLSDSTIYMAYYTIAHLLKLIPIDFFTYEVWDYIFSTPTSITNKPQCIIGSEYESIIDEMKHEFNYWYPVDVRVSGKDLITNHLTMTLYNHMAIWGEDYCPRQYCINGYIMLDGKKMSKSEGIFMTLREAVDRYGSDIVKLTLTEKEGVEDANFGNKIAETYTKFLSTEKNAIMKLIDSYSPDTTMTNENNLWENMYDAELDFLMIKASENYRNYKFRSVVYDSFRQLLNSRADYLKFCEKTKLKPSQELVKKFIEYVLVIIYPICPLWVESIWEYAKTKNLQLNHKWIDCAYPEKYFYYKFVCDSIESIAKKVNDSFRKVNMKMNMSPRKISAEIEIIEKFTEIEYELIERVKEFFATTTYSEANWINYVESLKQVYGDRGFNNYRVFMGMIKIFAIKYGVGVYDHMNDNKKIFNQINKWLRYFVTKECMNMKITFIEGSNEKYQFVNGPHNPLII